ncbi:MAG TPA: ABC transporter permease [Blastocatellia bacterium]|nr:ABC transporter permease [Blastocatellia bacterium]
MRTFGQDLRYGARMLFKNPGFTLIAVITLALGIGANAAIFSLVDKLIVQSLPVKDPASLVNLQGESVNPKFTISDFSWSEYLDYRARNQVFDDLIAFTQDAVNLGSGDQLEQVRAELVTENYFSLLGVTPNPGRTFAPEENRAPGAHPVAVISYGLWQRRFSGGPGAIGRTLTVNETSYTVVGIAPASFKGMMIESPTDLWVPVMMRTQIEQIQNDEWVGEREWKFLKLVGRLKPGVALETAQGAMDTLARQVRNSAGPERESAGLFGELRMQLVPGGKGLSTLRGEMGDLLKFLLAVVGLVLLIACANIAGLLLARSAARRKELAVRSALGAGRGRLVAQLLTESFLLAMIGGGAGIVIAPWLTDLLLFYQTRVQSANVTLGQVMNWRVAGFTLAVSLLAALFFGLIPAWQASRPDLVQALKNETTLRRDQWNFTISRRGLIVVQVALSLVVLICAGLFLRSLDKLFAVDLGFNPAEVLIAEIELPMRKYDRPKSEQFYQRLVERLKALPGVESVTTAHYTPLSGIFGLNRVAIEGQPAGPGEAPMVYTTTVGPGYYELLGIPLLAGRSFTEQDRRESPGVAIVNEAFAKRFFAGQNALGRRIRVDTDQQWLEIVGITRDTKSLTLSSETEPQFDLPVLKQGYDNPQRVLIKARRPAESLIPAVRRQVRALDPALAFFKTTTIEADLRATIASWRMASALMSLFGAVTLILVAVGLYGVIVHSVHRRTREIGIRMALGANPGNVLRLVLREGLGLIGLGTALGLGVALAAIRLIKSHLFGVSAVDPLTFAAVILLLLAVALLACWIPARWATRVDPMIALRCD